MVGVPLAGRRSRPAGRTPRTRGDDPPIGPVLQYAQLGWPSCPGAFPLTGGPRACSCDRVGCPDAGTHPTSPAWQLQATVDPAALTRWWEQSPRANVVLPTGAVFDVFDVPARAGTAAVARMEAAGFPIGPVAAYGSERLLFFVATRGAPEDEEEWWSCHLDCVPETLEDNPGLRWHCRNSYVLAPPSRLPSGGRVTWLHEPDGRPLPDALRVLDWLC